MKNWIKILLVSLWIVLIGLLFHEASNAGAPTPNLQRQQQMNASYLLELWMRQARAIVDRLHYIDMLLADRQLSYQQRNGLMQEKNALLVRLAYVQSQIRSIQSGMKQ